MSRVLVIAITAIGCNWFAVSACMGEPINASPDTATEELKALHDPTILESRIWLDSEWNKFKDDSNDLQQTVAGVWAWPISGRQDWGVRLKVPFIMRFAGDASGHAEKQGLGDIELAMGTAFRLSKTWRAGGGLQFRTPSGTDEDLSDNTWRLQEFGAVAWDATPWLTFSPSFEHNHSVAEQSGTAPQHFLELFFPATFLMASQWALTAQYEIKIDFANNDARTHSGKLQLAKRLEELPLAFAFSIKKPFEGDKEFQVNFVSTYYF
jgi:hypothetical protein